MKIPIFIYHEITTNDDEYKYSFSKIDFDNHLNTIKKKGIQCITVEQLEKQFKSNSMPRDKFALITFDDGHNSNYDFSYPILIKNNIKATFFITTDFIDKKGFITKNNIYELSLNGMSIQSHAKSHNFLNKMHKHQIHSELDVSKKILEDITGKEVNFLSIPGGRFNINVIQCAAELGYHAIFTSNPFQSLYSNGISLYGRIGLRNPLPIYKFENFLKPTSTFILKNKTSYILKLSLKKIIGGDLYYNIWKKIVKR